jgi:hypothetical protein
MENIVHSLKIDKELLLMTPPLSDSDSRLLRIRLSEGIDTATVCVWNTTVIDGFEKYEKARSARQKNRRCLIKLSKSRTEVYYDRRNGGYGKS